MDGQIEEEKITNMYGPQSDNELGSLANETEISISGDDLLIEKLKEEKLFHDDMIWEDVKRREREEVEEELHKKFGLGLPRSPKEQDDSDQSENTKNE